MLELKKISGENLNRKLSRANNAVRMMRIHAYLCVLYVFPTFTVDLIVFNRPSFPLLFAAIGGVIAISSGLRDSAQCKTRGPISASIGMVLAAYVSLGHFFFPELSLGAISPVQRTDTDFRAVQFLALALYGATLSFSIFCAFGLTDRVVASHHVGLGLDQSAGRSLSYICLGTFGRPGAKLNPRAFPTAAMAFLFFGWAFYVLYGIPLGFFAISNAAEVQRIIGFDTFIATQIPVTVIKVGLVLLLLSIARRLVVKARQIVTDSEISEFLRSRRLGVLYLRSFRFDKLGGARGDLNIWARFLDVELGSHMLEEVASKVWAAQGGMVALELPSKRDVSDGAIRFSFDAGSDWQAQISDLMLKAERLCVVLDGTEGVLWELEELVRLDLLKKTTVVFPAIFSIQNADQETRRSLEEKLGFGFEGTDLSSQFPLVWFLDSTDCASVVEMPDRRRDSYEAALLIASNQLGRGNLLKFPNKNRRSSLVDARHVPKN